MILNPQIIFQYLLEKFKITIFQKFSLIYLIFLSNLKDIRFYMGIGDWGLGIGDWGLGPIPNPQSPIPNPHFNFSLNFN